MMLNYSNSMEKEKNSYQSNLFNNDNCNNLLINLQDTTEWTFQEKLDHEYQSLGLYLSAHPLDSYKNILPKMDITQSVEILSGLEKYLKKNVRFCGLIIKILKRQSPRGRWATIQINDLSGSIEISIYSDILVKYENYLKEKSLILIDTEIKNENNQSPRIVAKRIISLNDYIADNNYNITLFTKSNKHLNQLVPLLGVLEFGRSTILINSSNDFQEVEIKIKENVKLSSNFINDISNITGIDHINFSERL